jgi:hypothetical protein
MLRKTALIPFVVALSLVVAGLVLAGGGPVPRNEDGTRIRPVVYVTNQGLYFDSIVGPNLPMEGPFQRLFPPHANPDWDGETLSTELSTEFGPGDPGHVGGRWWVDVNGNEEMDEGDAFFSCPLLGPGRYEP